ncbi:MAG: TAXI family TRAP transporter solute-binding subunit [Paracoccaceae bacterium]
MSKTKTIVAGAVAALMAISGASVAQEAKYVNIGTGGIGGDFYPSGGYICNLLNKGRKKYGYNIRCTVESTAGSVANLRSIQAGELSVGLSEADSQLASWNGTGSFEAVGANKDLRYLFALGADVMHVVTRKDTGVTNFLDLKGMVVNTGNAGSGTEALINTALKAYGSSPDEFFKQVTKLTSREQAQALCDGKIDAFIYPVAISGATIAEATNTCDAVVVSWNDADISAMIDGVGYFSPMVIPAGTYRGQDSDSTTWAMPATILADVNADDEVIYNLVKAVFDNFEDLKKQSSIYTGATREGAVTAGRSVPYHPAALRYYKEVGLIK